MRIGEMRGWRFFRTKDVAIFPYMPGTEVYRDGMLPFLYNKLKEERKVGLTFCGEEKTQDQFVSYFDRIKTMQVLAEVGGLVDPENPEGERKIIPVGFSWVDSPVGVDGERCAMPGEAFFDNASKRSSARDLARLALGYVMNDLRVNIFHGVQLASNIAARNFSMRLGFRDVGIIPKRLYHEGKLQDARIMMLTDEDFLPPFWEWIKEKHLEMDAQKPVEREPALV
jgi:RimJ/RimL family protein N-acetyltransferase